VGPFKSKSESLMTYMEVVGGYVKHMACVRVGQGINTTQ
jgi:hypothetical protein